MQRGKPHLRIGAALGAAIGTGIYLLRRSMGTGRPQDATASTLFDRLWGPVVVQDRVRGTPEQVYAVLSEPRTYPDWLVGADRIRSLDPEFPSPGSVFHHSVGPADPLTIDDTSESLEAEPDRHLALLVHAGPFHARVDFQLEPAGAGTTRICFSEQPTGPVAVLTPMLRPILLGRNERSLENLKKTVERTR